MLRIKNVDEGIPDGWWYVQPETGFKVIEGDYYHLLIKIKEHRRANNIPIGINFEAEIQDAICSRLSGRAFQCAQYDPGKDPRAPRKRVVLEDLTRFFGVVTALIKSGTGFVERDEANRRAKICVLCPYNISVEGCSGCRGVLNLVTGLIGRRSTIYDGELRGCEICGCENKTSVHLDLEAQQSVINADLNSEFPNFCWKKRQ